MNPVNPMFIWVSNSPLVSLGKDGSLAGELARIGFPFFEAWRVPRDSIIVVRFHRAITLRLLCWLILEP
jgi:hypothetical protein